MTPAHVLATVFFLLVGAFALGVIIAAVVDRLWSGGRW